MVDCSVLGDDSLVSWVDELYPDPEATGPSLALPPLATLLQEGQHASLRVRVEKHLEKRVAPTTETLQTLWQLRQSGTNGAQYAAARVIARSGQIE